MIVAEIFIARHLLPMVCSQFLHTLDKQQVTIPNELQLSTMDKKQTQVFGE